ncbi:MAG: glutamine synthetase, partial [Deltaproteobacteria bacterium]
MEEVLAALEAPGVTKAKVAVSDIDGVLRGKYLDARKCAEALRGSLGFCSVVFGWDVGDRPYPGGSTKGYPDVRLRLDPNSLRRIPWEHNTPLLLADFYQADGAPLAICPRQLLKGQIAAAAELGLTASFGAEFEWFNFRETPQTAHAKDFHDLQPLSTGMFGYSLLRAGQSADFLHTLFDTLGALRVPLESLHTETGPGVLEASLLHSDALEAADRAAVFKYAVKELAHRSGLLATFMAKFSDTLPGCGGHLHQSLLRAGHSAFFDAQAPGQMSATLRHYVAGELQLA